MRKKDTIKGIFERFKKLSMFSLLISPLNPLINPGSYINTPSAMPNIFSTSVVSSATKAAKRYVESLCGASACARGGRADARRNTPTTAGALVSTNPANATGDDVTYTSGRSTLGGRPQEHGHGEHSKVNNMKNKSKKKNKVNNKMNNKMNNNSNKERKKEEKEMDEKVNEKKPVHCKNDIKSTRRVS